jgi:hypothetical protein
MAKSWEEFYKEMDKQKNEPAKQDTTWEDFYAQLDTNQSEPTVDLGNFMEPKQVQIPPQFQKQSAVTPEQLKASQDKLLGLNVIKTLVGQTPARLQKSLRGNNLQPLDPQYQNIGQRLVQDASSQIEQIKKQNQIQPGSAGEFIADVGGGLLETVPSLAFTVATKNPLPLLAQTGLTSYGQTYAANREMGADPEQSRISAGSSALFDTAANVIPTGRLLKPGVSLGKKLITQIAEQGLADAGAEAFKTAVDTMTVNPNMTLQEGLGRIGTAGLTGGVMGGLIGTGVDPFVGRTQPVKKTIKLKEKIPQNVQENVGLAEPEIKPPSKNEMAFGSETSGKPLGIIFKPKSTGKQVSSRSKGLVVDQVQNQLEQIAPTLNKIVDYKQTKTPLQKLPSVLYQKLVDNQHFINKFTKETGSKTASLDPYKMASNSRSTPGTVNFILTEGLVNKKGERIGNSFKEVVDLIPKNQEHLVDDYLLHRHNVDRMGFVDKAEIQL